jgi:hypothetical protein
VGTHDCWFRLITTIIGFAIPDAWKALRYSVGSKHPLKDIGMMEFVTVAIKEILTNKQAVSDDPEPARNLAPLCTTVSSDT